MNLLGNLIWLLLGGIIGAIVWAIAGLIWCATIDVKGREIING